MGKIVNAAQWLSEIPDALEMYADDVPKSYMANAFEKTKWMKRVYCRAKVAELIARGYTGPNIAQEVGCHERTVGEDVKVIWRAWKRQQMGWLNEVIVLQLQQIDLVIKESWLAWDRSVGEKVEHTLIKENSDKTGKKKGKRVHRKNDAGDPRFLDHVLKALAQRAKLLGINAPERLEVTDSRPYQVAVSKLSVEELEVLSSIRKKSQVGLIEHKAEDVESTG